jgi:hypothetical protein
MVSERLQIGILAEVAGKRITLGIYGLYVMRR